MSVERLLPQMLMSTAAILVGILLVLMGLLRMPPIGGGPVAYICITAGPPGCAGEP